MAPAVSEPIDAPPQPLTPPRRYRPGPAIAIVVVLATLTAGGAMPYFPDFFSDAPVGDRAKHGRGYVPA